jgi:hypothetical protein
MIIGPTDRRVVDSDAWELSLFWLPVGIFTKPPIPTYPLEEAIEAGTVVFLDREPHGESQDIHMRIIVPPVSLDETDQPRRYEVWVDQKRNWLIRKAVHTIENRDGSALWEVSAEVTDLLEIKPTVYVPTTCAITTKYRGKTITKAIATFKDVKVNEAMSAIPPMPAVPQGSVVINEIDGTVWRTDAKGGPVGKPRHTAAERQPLDDRRLAVALRRPVTGRGVNGPLEEPNARSLNLRLKIAGQDGRFDRTGP